MIQPLGPIGDRSGLWVEAAVAIFLVLFPIVFPLVGGDSSLATRILVLGLFGLGVDLIFGFTGLLSFGQAAFYGTGGFVTAYLTIHHIVDATIPALIVGTLVAAFFGFVIGTLALRQVGVYFAMLTLAFSQLFYFLDNSPLRNFTGGENGLPGVPRPVIPLGFTTIELHSNLGVYGFVAVLYFIGFVVARRIVRSPFGAVLRSILENSGRAAAVGHDVGRYKLTIFTIAAAYGGLAGGLLGIFQGYMPPDAFTVDQSGEIIVMTVIGGAGTLIGPLIGAGIWLFLRQELQAVALVSGGWKLILGIVFVLLVTGFRRGVAGGVISLFGRRRRTSPPPAAPAAEA
ncbi:MAG: branched-chain amino acid ABC transporter permease [Vulcanimicrobiaceae bacterium]